MSDNRIWCKPKKKIMRLSTQNIDALIDENANLADQEEARK